MTLFCLDLMVGGKEIDLHWKKILKLNDWNTKKKKKQKKQK